jgi:hypothetical protein
MLEHSSLKVLAGNFLAGSGKKTRAVSEIAPIWWFFCINRAEQ